MTCYRALRNAVDRRYDVARFQLHELIWQCLLNHGHVPEEKLEQFLPYVPQPTIDFLERLTTQMMFGDYGLLSNRRKLTREEIAKVASREGSSTE